MSRKRQSIQSESIGPENIQLRTFSVRFGDGHVIDEHAHKWGQLIYATRGVMSVYTDAGVWVVPSLRAVWVPAGVPHRIVMSGSVMMRTLYFSPELVDGGPATCRVINVSPLLRELIVYVVAIGMLDRTKLAQARLIDVILDQLEILETMGLELPSLRDRRALRVAEILYADPSDPRPLADLGSQVGASKRTLERLFLRETGMTFGNWRRQLRLIQALRLLAGGESVTAVALEVGYDSPSAFIAMFKSKLGITPSRYYAVITSYQKE